MAYEPYTEEELKFKIVDGQLRARGVRADHVITASAEIRPAHSLGRYGICNVFLYTHLGQGPTVEFDFTFEAIEHAQSVHERQLDFLREASAESDVKPPTIDTMVDGSLCMVTVFGILYLREVGNGIWQATRDGIVHSEDFGRDALIKSLAREHTDLVNKWSS